MVVKTEAVNSGNAFGCADEDDAPVVGVWKSLASKSKTSGPESRIASNVALIWSAEVRLVGGHRTYSDIHGISLCVEIGPAHLALAG